MVNNNQKKPSKPKIHLDYGPAGVPEKKQAEPADDGPSLTRQALLWGFFAAGVGGVTSYFWTEIQKKLYPFFAQEEVREVQILPIQTIRLLQKIGFYSLEAPFKNIREADISQTAIYDQRTPGNNSYLLQARLTDRTMLEIEVEDKKRGDGTPGIDGTIEKVRIEILHREEHVQATAVQASVSQQKALPIGQLLYREMCANNIFQ
ncbi:hypothetical protein HYV84_02755 [Candidatus Woesearchaeota archaeon]|nr:hypothetical protein [Candidatus Woesearchaeota archaeon]